MKITLSKRALKTLKSLNNSARARIMTGINEIPVGNIVPLRGAKGSYRLRIGDWRVIFSYVEKETVSIDKISPRGDAYKGV